MMWRLFSRPGLGDGVEVGGCELNLSVMFAFGTMELSEADYSNATRRLCRTGKRL